MSSVLQALVGLVGLLCSAVLTLGLVSDHETAADVRTLILARLDSADGAHSTPSDEGSAMDNSADEMDFDAIGFDPEVADEPLSVSRPDEFERSKRPVAQKRATGRSPKTYHRTLRVTAYCDRGTTASGVQSGVGQCAAPADIPFGSKIYIPALGRTFVVTDRTHRRFRHNTVDIFMPTEWSCRQFGRSYLKCEITLPERPMKYGGGS